MRMTSVVWLRASTSQSRVERGSPGATCPDTTVNPCDKDRCVTGIPPARVRRWPTTPGGSPAPAPRPPRTRGTLAAAPEHEGVATLEPDDAASGPGVLDHQGVDVLLPGPRAGISADVDQPRVRTHEPGNRGREVIDQDDVRRLERAQPPRASAARVARTAAHERDGARRGLGRRGGGGQVGQVDHRGPFQGEEVGG